MYSNNNDGDFFASRPTTRAEREVYGYIRGLARLEDSDQAIEGFYQLLFHGLVRHPELDFNSVRQALFNILELQEASKILPYIINRCFYTMGNPWRLNSQRHYALRKLVTQAQELPKRRPTDRRVRRLVDGMVAYVNNDALYVPLQRQMRLLSDHTVEEKTSLGNCFKDYFFIYESASVTRDIPLQDRKSIQKERQHQAQRLNRQLHDYWQAYKAGEQAVNPTKLSNDDLAQAICTFHPEGTNAYRKQAQSFEKGARSLRTSNEFIEPFYHYVMEPLVQVDERYSSKRFGKVVKDVLSKSVGNINAPLTDISINHMCTRLLKLLVSNTLDCPETVYFEKLIKTVGARVVTAVLLKVILFRRTVRSWFEDRFGILFHLWENFELSQITWLVDAFEHMNVALALNAPWVNYVPRPRVTVS